MTKLDKKNLVAILENYVENIRLLPNCCWQNELLAKELIEKLQPTKKGNVK